MRLFLTAARLFTVSFLFVGTLAAQTPIGGSLNDTELRAFLKDNYYVVTSLGYTPARDRMYGQIDNLNGRVTCVYSGYSKIGSTRAQMNDTTGTGVVQINAEHTWPQSLFGSNEPMQSDIHHLYPTWGSVNSSRSNNPFGQIDDNQSSTWYGGSYLNPISANTKPGADVIHLYSQSSGGKFEPRADHRGDVARTMFYFWTMYSAHPSIVAQNAVNINFFNGMKDVLYAWHKADPVDSKELNRTNAIASYQGKPNPFILDSTLVRRAFFYVATSIESGDPLPNSFTVSPAYPNPFNPLTSVSVDLPSSTHLTIGLFDVMGREVRSIVSGSYSAGSHTVSVDGAGLASGVYYIRVTSATQRSIVPVLLLK